jgi:hypothetical protein
MIRATNSENPWNRRLAGSQNGIQGKTSVSPVPLGFAEKTGLACTDCGCPTAKYDVGW